MKKLLNKKGFTLMEMMIVVAIIVVLVAISIPTFTGSLNKAHSATDAANLRAAKSLAINSKLSGDTTRIGKFYDYDTADVTTQGSADKGYCTNHSNAVIKLTSDGAVWVDAQGNEVNQNCAQ